MFSRLYNRLAAGMLIAIFLLSTNLQTIAQKSQSKADMVDMFMGIHGTGYCVVGPQLPHGSVNPSPQTPNGKHGGYQLNQPIRGFGQLHVSGTGWGRYGQIFLSPQIGFTAQEEEHDSQKSHEIAKPYYYSVNLTRYGIKAEITPTHHGAAYRFTFPKSDDANILLDMTHNLPQHIAPEVRGAFLGGEIHYDKNSRSINGWGKYKGGFGSGEPYKIFFSIQLDVDLKDLEIENQKTDILYARLNLPDNVSIVNLQIGISLKSIENAKLYVSKELAFKSFEEVKEDAKRVWDEQLSSIEIVGATEKEQKLFYTTLYHSFVMPRDRTDDNPHWESDMPHLDDHYCVWDTWRTKYPLMILLQESFVAKTINSFIDRFTHNGICNPTFTSSLEWGWKQGGDDVDNIIADAMVKNVKGFDYDKAYEILKWNAFHTRSEDYLKSGWMPEKGNPMACSYNVEYAYNDYCAAMVADILNDKENAQLLWKRSHSWENIFNPNLESYGFKGFIGPRKEDGEWIAIDPAEVYGSWVEYFYESNSWTYTLFTPHHFDRLIALCGGKEEMTRRLSYGFDHNLIHLSNEPGFLAPFIFSHCGRPDLTAHYVSKIRESHFSIAKGYSDNEDSGAMGSWYIFTSMGLFPNAGQDFYYLLPPAFSKIRVKMENGKEISIQTLRNKSTDCYIESVSINGKLIDRPYLFHNEIANGATIVFKLTDKKDAWK